MFHPTPSICDIALMHLFIEVQQFPRLIVSLQGLFCRDLTLMLPSMRPDCRIRKVSGLRKFQTSLGTMSEDWQMSKMTSSIPFNCLWTTQNCLLMVSRNVQVSLRPMLFDSTGFNRNGVLPRHPTLRPSRNWKNSLGQGSGYFVFPQLLLR